MAKSQADDDSETEANVDLKGVIKDLATQIEILNKALAQFSQGMGQTSKDFHKTHGEKLAEIAAQGKMVQDNLKFRKSLQGAETSMSLFTGMLKKGVTPMLIMESIGKKLGGVSQEFDDMQAKQKEYSDFLAKHKGKDLTKDVNRPLLEQEKQLKEGAAQSKEKYEQGKGGKAQQLMTKGLSKMGRFADKHMGGMIIGAGSAMILISILKKAFDASPMFQQMLKLFNFGFMMVLRPIGDFFGFLFRPILIMLLRKFIIPWYTKLMPVMIKMGNLIGEKLSGAFEALAKGDVALAFALLFKDVDFGVILGDMTQGIRDWIDNTDWDQVKTDIGDALIALGLGLWAYVLLPLGQFIYDELKEWWDFGIKSITASWDKYWDSVYTWFDDGVTGITTTWSDFWDSIYNWFDTGITNATVSWTSFWDMIKDAVWKTITGQGGTPQPSPSTAGTDPEPSKNWWEFQHGGHITEPMAAIGLRSGRRVMMGEAGNETVIPDDQLAGMGGGITINIQNMSASQQDLNNLRQVILDVVQQSSARRGRA